VCSFAEQHNWDSLKKNFKVEDKGLVLDAQMMVIQANPPNCRRAGMRDCPFG